MTDRYVGPGGNNGNSGLTWVLRKETLVGVEATVAAGDTVYVGPGVYRETLTIAYDTSGTSGNPITYVGDVTGENTDGIGGICKISGHDDDTDPVADRSSNIYFQEGGASSCADYRTFRGLTFQGYLGWTDDGNIVWELGSSTNIIIEDCVFMPNTNSTFAAGGNTGAIVPSKGMTYTDWNIRRNICWGQVSFYSCQNVGGDTSTTISFENNFIFNCTRGLYILNSYGWEAIGNTFWMIKTDAIQNGLIGTGTNTFYDNLFVECQYSINNVSVTNTTVHDYNNFCRAPLNGLTNNTNEITTYHPFNPPLLISNTTIGSGTGIRMPWNLLRHSKWYQHPHQTDGGALADDFYGLTRPGNNKRTRGAVQWNIPVRDAEIRRQGLSSLALEDAGRHVAYVPVNPGKTYRITVYARRETNYAGTNPQLVITRPGQSDITVTDVGSSGVWNKLSSVVTMGSDDKWMQLNLVSNNTATSGDYRVNFDSLYIKVNQLLRKRWVNDVIIIYWLLQKAPLDTWVSPTVTPSPVAQPDMGTAGPLPMYFRPG